jgi:predicted ester cyclase
LPLFFEEREIYDPSIDQPTLEPLMKTTHILALGALAALLPALPAFADDDLVRAREVIADPSLAPAQWDAEMLAARRYATFWHTGDARYARAALAADFTDRTLPAGRAQGVPGPLAASAFVRTAIPDLQADVRQMIVAGDRVTVHFRFHGHFTGRWGGRQGQGQAVDFIATDIYRIADGKIADNWHIEDNLTLMQQLGLVAR